MSVLKVWAAMAWADDVMAPAEAEALRRLVDSAPISDAEREVALGWIRQPVALETEFAGRLGEEARLGVYRAAVRLARVDLELAVRERELLDRLRDALAIDLAAAAELESSLG
jgi:hypothetical protein